MIGAIIGDIVGSRFECNNHRNKEFEFFSSDCFATDDSIMTLAVGKAVMEWKKSKDSETLSELTKKGIWSILPWGKSKDTDSLSILAVKYMREIGQNYPTAGYGLTFRKRLFGNNTRPYNSCGNGAAMRVSACGLVARSEEEAKKMSRAVTKVTHNHPQGIKGAEALTVAIYMAKNRVSKEGIKKRIEADYYRLNFTLDGIRGKYIFNETCQGTVPQAITAFLESVSFEDAIRNAVSIGGDSDTIGAITGALAEAYYGVPVELRNRALDYLENDLFAIVKEWDKFVLSQS